MEALSAAGTDLGPSGLEVGAVEFMPVGPSPGESQRARALRLWVGKGVLRPQPIQDPALPGEPSLPACACTFWLLFYHIILFAFIEYINTI